MTDKERNKFTMIKNVQTTMSEYSDVVKLYSKLDHNASLNGQTELIKQNDIVYSTVKLGTTDQKNSAKENLASVLATRCCTVSAFATDENDLELKALVDESESVLLKLPNEDLPKKAKVILEKIKKFKEPLMGYGLGDEEISELETALTEYDSKLGNKEQKTQTSVVARSDLSGDFSKADEILNQLDNIMQGLSKKHAEFCKNYFQARNIKNLGGGHGGSDDPGSGGDNNPPKAAA